MRRNAFLLAVVSCAILFISTPTRAPAAPSAASRALDSVLPELNFAGVTLNDALDFIRDTSGMSMHVNWPALEAAGVSKDTQINIRLNRVSTRKALSLTLSEAGAGTALAFYVDDGVLEVT